MINYTIFEYRFITFVLLSKLISGPHKYFIYEQHLMNEQYLIKQKLEEQITYHVRHNQV